MVRDPFSCKYSNTYVSTYLCWHLQVVAPSGSSSNNYQLLRTSRVTATGTTVDTSTDTGTTTTTATAIATPT
jgi:hypothetical protein